MKIVSYENYGSEREVLQRFAHILQFKITIAVKTYISVTNYSGVLLTTYESQLVAGL